jgi:GNAT superfamily N-acetyltransferase
VVASDVRGRGIGRALVHEAEQWARAKGSPRMSLTSGVQRAEAHEFYKRLGYEQTGVRLTKVF